GLGVGRACLSARLPALLRDQRGRVFLCSAIAAAILRASVMLNAPILTLSPSGVCKPFGPDEIDVLAAALLDDRLLHDYLLSGQCVRPYSSPVRTLSGRLNA